MVYLMAMGPLDPPPGPVSETSPSLADLEMKIDLLELRLSALDQGPYKSIYIGPDRDEDRLQAKEEVAGRVLLHKIIVRNAGVAVFDGPGTTTAHGPESGAGIVAGWAYHLPTGQQGTAGIVHRTIEIEFNTVIQNGLYLAYDSFGDEHSTQVLYKELP